MNRVKINIWSREFELDIKYDCFEDEEELLPEQENAVIELLKYRYVIDHSLENLKEYCLEKNSDKYSNGNIDNIFKYVIPAYLYVMRTDKDRSVAVVCHYKYDLEHGIAVVFKNEKLSKIGTMDIIL